MSTISCYDVRGNPAFVAADSVVFRPAVYGICIENGEALLLRDNDQQTGLLRPPGRILESGNTPIQVIRREYRRLTGMTPLVGPLIFMEDLYRVDTNGCAWRLSAMYYWVERPTAVTITSNPADSSPQLEMHDVYSLQRSQLHFGYKAIQAALLRVN